ncbi:MAG: TrkA family potassium uptake protein [Aquificota bacterium]|nr:TrkA family potassium uptake protein [Aquificota bacterium]
MKRTFGVIGLGKFGFYVARTLSEAGMEVIAMDKDPEKVRQVSDFVTHAYIADALDEKALEESGILTSDTVIVSIGTNVEASILITVMLLKRGVREVVAKAINPPRRGSQQARCEQGCLSGEGDGCEAGKDASDIGYGCGDTLRPRIQHI